MHRIDAPIAAGPVDYDIGVEKPYLGFGRRIADYNSKDASSVIGDPNQQV